MYGSYNPGLSFQNKGRCHTSQGVASSWEVRPLRSNGQGLVLFGLLLEGTSGYCKPCNISLPGSAKTAIVWAQRLGKKRRSFKNSEQTKALRIIKARKASGHCTGQHREHKDYGVTWAPCEARGVTVRRLCVLVSWLWESKLLSYSFLSWLGMGWVDFKFLAWDLPLIVCDLIMSFWACSWSFGKPWLREPDLTRL